MSPTLPAARVSNPPAYSARRLLMTRRAEHRSAKLFAMREDTRVEYGADVQKRLKRKWEAPDTVFALKVSGTLKEKLTALNRKGATVGKTLMACLNPTLFPNEAHPIVFPFLLGESKSESSCGSFTRINLQMALVIEESLNIQERLRQMAGEECEWVAGPLVWCLSHHGPTWRLSAGYMRTRGKVKIVSPRQQTVHVASLTLWCLGDHDTLARPYYRS